MTIPCITEHAFVKSTRNRSQCVPSMTRFRLLTDDGTLARRRASASALPEQRRASVPSPGDVSTAPSDWSLAARLAEGSPGDRGVESGLSVLRLSIEVGDGGADQPLDWFRKLRHR